MRTRPVVLCWIRERVQSAAWPELTITRVHLKKYILTIQAKRGEVRIDGAGPAGDPLVVQLPKGWKLAESSAGCDLGSALELDRGIWWL